LDGEQLDDAVAATTRIAQIVEKTMGGTSGALYSYLIPYSFPLYLPSSLKDFSFISLSMFSFCFFKEEPKSAKKKKRKRKEAEGHVRRLSL
jgi:hypothetical protein